MEVPETQNMRVSKNHAAHTSKQANVLQKSELWRRFAEMPQPIETIRSFNLSVAQKLHHFSGRKNAKCHHEGQVRSRSVLTKFRVRTGGAEGNPMHFRNV